MLDVLILSTVSLNLSFIFSTSLHLHASFWVITSELSSNLLMLFLSGTHLLLNLCLEALSQWQYFFYFYNFYFQILSTLFSQCPFFGYGFLYFFNHFENLKHILFIFFRWKISFIWSFGGWQCPSFLSLGLLLVDDYFLLWFVIFGEAHIQGAH